MTLFWILAVLIVVVAVISAGGYFRGPRRTHIVDRDVVRAPIVDEVVEQPVVTRRVARRVR